jgi:sugar lactone lactonase YvrE
MKKLTLIIFVVHFSFFILKAQKGVIITLAGTTTSGYNGDGIKAVNAQLNQDGGVAVDDSGNVYIADSQNNRIRKVNKISGLITTIAGTGDAGYSGDSGKAILAQCTYPICVRLDTLRNIYFSDAGNNLIRKINPEGMISTIAGNGNSAYKGDTGKAVNASLNYPVGIALDKDLNIYIADQSNNVIRKVTAATGIITTIAGDTIAGYKGDGGKATAAELHNPTGVAVDNRSNIYIADFKNNVIRMVNNNGIISTFAGTGVAGYNGYKGLAKAIQLNNPAGVSTDAAGNIYVADAGNSMALEILSASGQVNILAGNGSEGYKGDGGQANKAEISYPFDIITDIKGNIYLADLGNNRVREFNAPVSSSSTAPSVIKHTSGNRVQTYGSEFTHH